MRTSRTMWASLAAATLLVTGLPAKAETKGYAVFGLSEDQGNIIDLSGLVNTPEGYKRASWVTIYKGASNVGLISGAFFVDVFDFDCDRNRFRRTKGVAFNQDFERPETYQSSVGNWDTAEPSELGGIGMTIVCHPESVDTESVLLLTARSGTLPPIREIALDLRQVLNKEDGNSASLVKKRERRPSESRRQPTDAAAAPNSKQEVHRPDAIDRSRKSSDQESSSEQVRRGMTEAQVLAVRGGKPSRVQEIDPRTGEKIWFYGSQSLVISGGRVVRVSP